MASLNVSLFKKVFVKYVLHLLGWGRDVSISTLHIFKHRQVCKVIAATNSEFCLLLVSCLKILVSSACTAVRIFKQHSWVCTHICTGWLHFRINPTEWQGSVWMINKLAGSKTYRVHSQKQTWITCQNLHMQIKENCTHPSYLVAPFLEYQMTNAMPE